MERSYDFFLALAILPRILYCLYLERKKKEKEISLTIQRKQ